MTPRRPLPNAELFALAGLTLAALALRLVGLDRLPLWEDEGATWWYARLIADGRLMEGIRLEPTPPLYYLLVAGVTAVLGPSDGAMRLPSAVFGALSIPAIFFLARTLARSFEPSSGLRVARFTAWTAAVLLAVHPLHVFYSREARVYPLLLLLTLLLWMSLHRALRHRALHSGTPGDALRSWAAVSGLLLLIAYSHYYSLFLFAAAGLLVLVLAPDARTLRRGVVAVAVPGLLFLPYVALTLPHLRASGAAWSVAALYEIFPGDRSFLRVLEMAMLGADYPVYLRDLAVPPTAAWLRWTAIAVQTVLIFLALRLLGRRARAGGAARFDLVFWLVAWLVPLLLPWAITHGVRAIFHPGRHDVYGLWGLLFGVALGLGRLLAGGPRRKMVAALAATLLLLAATGRLALLQAVPPNGTVTERAEWIAEQSRDRALDGGGGTTQVWTLGVKRLLTERYLRLELPDSKAAFSISSFPRATDSHPGWSDAHALMDDRQAILREASSRVAELPPETDLVFVVTAGAPPRPDGGLTAQGFLDAALVRALERGGWRRDVELSRPELDLLAFRRP